MKRTALLLVVSLLWAGSADARRSAKVQGTARSAWVSGEKGRQLAVKALARCGKLKVKEELRGTFDEEMAYYMWLSVRRSGRHLDIKRGDQGSGIDGGGMGSDYFYRIYLTPPKCSSICMWRATGADIKHHDGTYRFVAERRKPPTKKERALLAKMAGLVIQRKKAPAAPPALKPRPTRHVDKGWSLKGPIGGPGAAMPGKPRAALSRRYGGYSIHLTMALGRRDGQSLYVYDPKKKTHRFALSTDSTGCGGTVEYVGYHHKLLLLTCAYEHPALLAQRGQCLVVADVARGVSFQLGLPADGCYEEGADALTKSFTASIKGKNLAISCTKGSFKIPLRRLRAVVTRLIKASLKGAR